MGDRKHLRLRKFDYRTSGFYFVTVCTPGSRHLFVEVIEGTMQENAIAGLVRSCWKKIPEFYSNTVLDEFVIMPNHVHFLLQLLPVNKSEPSPAPLSKIVNAFKAAATKQVRNFKGDREFQLWQRGYSEHVVRSEEGLYRIRNYIRNNPLAWSLDKENLQRTGMDEFDQWLESL